MCSANPRLHRLTLQLTVYVFNRLVTKLFKRHNYEDVQKFGIRLQGTIPYHSGQAFYRLALRPSVGPMRIPVLTLRLPKPSTGFCKPRKSTPVFLS